MTRKQFVQSNIIDQMIKLSVLLIPYSRKLTFPTKNKYLKNLKDIEYEKNKDEIALYIRMKVITPLLFSEAKEYNLDSFLWNIKSQELNWIFKAENLR